MSMNHPSLPQQQAAVLSTASGQQRCSILRRPPCCLLCSCTPRPANCLCFSQTFFYGFLNPVLVVLQCIGNMIYKLWYLQHSDQLPMPIPVNEEWTPWVSTTWVSDPSGWVKTACVEPNLTRLHWQAAITQDVFYKQCYTVVMVRLRLRSSELSPLL